MTEEEFIEDKLRNALQYDPSMSLFDKHKSQTIEQCAPHARTHARTHAHANAHTPRRRNLQYMEKKFGFFVPYMDFVTDVPGLLCYLGEKVRMSSTAAPPLDTCRATCNVERVKCNMERATCRLQHVTCSMQLALRCCSARALTRDVAPVCGRACGVSTSAKATGSGRQANVHARAHFGLCACTRASRVYARACVCVCILMIWRRTTDAQRTAETRFKLSADGL